MSWDSRFMDLARFVSEWSKDRSTKVGAVVVDSRHHVRALGWNGFPRGLDDEIEERHGRPAKYQWTEHAERNAIYNAAAAGVPLAGCTIYIPWFPCCDCARAIIQAGVAEIVCMPPDLGDERWGADFRVVTVMLEEAGVVVRAPGERVER